MTEELPQRSGEPSLAKGQGRRTLRPPEFPAAQFVTNPLPPPAPAAHSSASARTWPRSSTTPRHLQRRASHPRQVGVVPRRDADPGSDVCQSSSRRRGDTIHELRAAPPWQGARTRCSNRVRSARLRSSQLIWPHRSLLRRLLYRCLCPQALVTSKSLTSESSGAISSPPQPHSNWSFDGDST